MKLNSIVWAPATITVSTECKWNIWCGAVMRKSVSTLCALPLHLSSSQYLWMCCHFTSINHDTRSHTMSLERCRKHCLKRYADYFFRLNLFYPGPQSQVWGFSTHVIKWRYEWLSRHMKPRSNRNTTDHSQYHRNTQVSRSDQSMFQRGKIVRCHMVAELVAKICQDRKRKQKYEDKSKRLWRDELQLFFPGCWLTLRCRSDCCPPVFMSPWCSLEMWWTFPAICCCAMLSVCWVQVESSLACFCNTVTAAYI